MDKTTYNNKRTHAAKKYKHAHTLHKRRKSHIHTQETGHDTEQSFYNNKKEKNITHTKRNEQERKNTKSY